MKTLLLAFSVLLAAQSFAGPKPKIPGISAKQIQSLTARLKTKAQKRKQFLNTKLVKFFVGPAQPKQGDEVSVFAQVESGFTDAETILEAKFDGQAVVLEKPAKELWIYDAGTFSEVKEHTFTATIYIQDLEEATQIRNAITSLEAEIASLNEQIDEATDPEVIAELIAQRDEKIALKNELVDALANLKSLVGEESFIFSIAGAATGTDYPRITAVSPTFGKFNEATEITISGANFSTEVGTTTEVKVGGANATGVSVTSGSITATTPVFGVEGLKDIEVRFTKDGKTKNAIMKNAFFATDTSAAIPQAPVAVAGPNQTVAYGTPATFSGSASYDPNPGEAIRYEWRVISKPLGSNLTVPTNPAETTEEFSVEGDVPGTYVLELKVFEENGSLESSPSLTVLEVTAPANRAPVATGGSISVSKNVSKTLQIGVTDEDTWQSRTFFVTKQGTLGTATVSSSGLVTYTAGPSGGSDSVHILVVDSGNPPLSSLVEIPVTVIENEAPVIGNLLSGITTNGPPYGVFLFTDSVVNDPDGSIVSMRWDFGDGTSERAGQWELNPIASIFHNYIATGSYNVSLTVTDELGAETVKNFTVNVVNTDIPVVRFTADTFQGPSPLTVNFDASASSDSDGIVRYHWNWTNGTPDTDEVTTSPTISHTFTNPGLQQIRLALVDAVGALTITTLYVDVDNPNALPVHPAIPDFQVSPTRRVLLGNAATFDGTRSFNPNVGGTVTDYFWNFDDRDTCPGGCTAGGSTPSYTYADTGTFAAQLMVAGPDSFQLPPVFQEVQVVNAGFAPRSLPHASVIEGPAPLTVNFTSESYDQDGTITQHLWGFGSDPNCVNTDCSPVGQNVTYTFENEDAYTIGLTVTDSDNNQHTNYVTVHVTNPGPGPITTMKKKKKLTNTAPKDPRREYNRQILTNLCAKGRGDSCFYLSKMYEEDGNASLAQKFKAKACSLGHLEACSAKTN